MYDRSRLEERRRTVAPARAADRHFNDPVIRMSRSRIALLVALVAAAPLSAQSVPDSVAGFEWDSPILWRRTVLIQRVASSPHRDQMPAGCRHHRLSGTVVPGYCFLTITTTGQQQHQRSIRYSAVQLEYASGGLCNAVGVVCCARSMKYEIAISIDSKLCP